MVSQSKVNGAKSQAGWDNQLALKELCEQGKREGLIREYVYSRTSDIKHFDTRKKQYFPLAQYKATFTITDWNGNLLLVYSSTSVKSDRIKATFWDALGVSKNSTLSKKIAAVIFVADTKSRDFDVHKSRSQNREIFSPITHWFYRDEFIDFLEQWKFEQAERKLGSNSGRSGNAFEKTILEKLNNSSSFEAYKNGTAEALIADVFTQSLNFGVKISATDVAKLSATRQIMLADRGLAKTDVSIEFELKGGSTKTVGLSLKNSKAESVSCHDYPAKQFINVLCRPDKTSDFSTLAEGLNIFQAHGNWDGINQKDSIWRQKFFAELKSKTNDLCDWALRGITPEQTSGDCIADILVIYNPLTNQHRVVPIEDYKKELIFNLSKATKRKTIFNWTRPSKQLGKRIQLKVPLNFTPSSQ